MQTILKDGPVKNNRGTWLVQCDCGSQPRYILKQRIPDKCKECAYKGKRPYRRKRPYEAQYNIFVGRARHPVTITYEQFVELTNIKECHCCHASVVWQEYRHKMKGGNGSNLDRKDNDMGYDIDNVVVCCQRCNYGKNKYFTYDEWVVMTRALAELQLWKEKQNDQ